MRTHTQSGIFFEVLEGRQMLSAAKPVTFLQDNFSGNKLNTKNWHIPQSVDQVSSSDTYLGRTTQLGYVGDSSLPKVGGGSVHLTLDTYNSSPIDTGACFLGTELVSNQEYEVGSVGLDVVVRARFNPAIMSSGLAGGVYLNIFNYLNEASTVFFSKEVSGANQVETNVRSFANADSYAVSSLPNTGQATDFHTYEMTIYPYGMYWYVDGKLVRTELNKVPVGSFQLYLNIWVPSSALVPEGYDPVLQPTSDPSQNVRFNMDIDSVTVSQASDGKAPVLGKSVWAEAPRGQYTDQVHMTANPVSDLSGVEYYFHNLTIAGHDSGWQSGRIFVDTGLSANTKYKYAVRVRDKSLNHNMSAYSAPASVKTPKEDHPVLVFTQTPGYESSGSLRGKVTGVSKANAANYGVYVYISVASDYSSPLPYWDYWTYPDPAPVDHNGNWRIYLKFEMDSRPFRYFYDNYYLAFLVPNDDDPPVPNAKGAIPNPNHYSYDGPNEMWGL